MLAQDLPDGEDARATVLGRAGPIAYLWQAAGTFVPRLGDVARRHHAAVTHDHGFRVACPVPQVTGWSDDGRGRVLFERTSTEEQRMKAVVCENTKLDVADVPDPVPGKGQLLIE